MPRRVSTKRCAVVLYRNLTHRLRIPKELLRVMPQRYKVTQLGAFSVYVSSDDRLLFFVPDPNGRIPLDGSDIRLDSHPFTILGLELGRRYPMAVWKNPDGLKYLVMRRAPMREN